jgi:hypothetical protein
MIRSFALAFSAIVLLALATATPVRAEVDPDTGLDLQETLEKGLKARRPEEFQFIARVATLVDQGGLPEDLVKSTFIWARKQPRHPFQYFERALIIRAAKLGIQL